VQATGVCSWRAEGIKYRKNEVYIDVIENVNILMSAKKERLRADVSGQILVRSQLSGMPECKFGMNDKLVMSSANRERASDKGIALDDYRFHQCVRLSKFDIDREITFIPPDGSFELMTYRITENIDSPFKLMPNIKVLGRNRLEISLQVIAMYDRNITATNVKIDIPCPKNTARGNIVHIDHGKARFEPTQGAIIWRIRRFPGRAEYKCDAEVELATTVTDKAWVRPPIAMNFDVPQFTASGLRVRFLKVQEKSNYKPVKWIRYLTRAGSYQHRI
jgi:AP-2 complex subunit mu-1